MKTQSNEKRPSLRGRWSNGRSRRLLAGAMLTAGTLLAGSLVNQSVIAGAANACQKTAADALTACQAGAQSDYEVGLRIWHEQIFGLCAVDRITEPPAANRFDALTVSALRPLSR